VQPRRRAAKYELREFDAIDCGAGVVVYGDDGSIFCHRFFENVPHRVQDTLEMQGELSESRYGRVRGEAVHRQSAREVFGVALEFGDHMPIDVGRNFARVGSTVLIQSGDYHLQLVVLEDGPELVVDRGQYKFLSFDGGEDGRVDAVLYVPLEIEEHGGGVISLRDAVEAGGVVCAKVCVRVGLEGLACHVQMPKLLMVVRILKQCA
jgi:hypothetical protein